MTQDLPRARKRRLRRILALALASVAVFACYATTTAQEHVSNDVRSSSLASWRVATAGQPWFDDFPLDEISRDPADLWTAVAENGHTAVVRSPGPIAVGIPAYALAGGGTAAADFSLLPGSLTAAGLAVASLLFLLLALRRTQRDVDAVACVLALGFTTPMWTVNADSLWTHAVTVVGIAGMAWAAGAERWWLVGTFGGIALWGRLHVALVVAVLGLGLALSRRQPRIALVVGSVSSVFMLAASLWSHWMYGVWSPAGALPTASDYTEGAITKSGLDHLVNEAGLWVSPDRGILVWTPVLVLLLPSVVRRWPSLPDWVRVLVVGGLLYSVVQGLLNVFAGGSGFYGYRLTLEVLVCLFPAYALSVRSMGRFAAAAVGPLLGLQFAAISLGAASNGFFLPLEAAWTDNSLALALRHLPLLWLWLALGTGLGYLAGRVWRDRRIGSSADPSLSEASTTTENSRVSGVG